MQGQIIAKVVEVQRERKIMFKDKKTEKMMTAFMRPIYIKDIDCTKIRVSIWRPPYKMAMDFINGKVYSFKNLQTDKYPDEKPHNLKSGYHSVIKMCSEDAEIFFSNVQDWDGCFEGTYQF